MQSEHIATSTTRCRSKFSVINPIRQLSTTYTYKKNIENVMTWNISYVTIVPILQICISHKLTLTTMVRAINFLLTPLYSKNIFHYLWNFSGSHLATFIQRWHYTKFLTYLSAITGKNNYISYKWQETQHFFLFITKKKKE
jgi:hypothetical protein